ncbi:MAG: aminopeptidase family protein P [bacterium]|nr:aminopeptidase family protein P [bacterium]
MSNSKELIGQRLAALYRRLAALGVDAYLIPSSDAHLNEYVPAYQRRRDAITGFKGSAGDALVSLDGNHLFVDSRYHIQAEQEVDNALFRVHKVGQADAYTLTGWFSELERQRGALRLGIDPFAVSMEAHTLYKRALQHADSVLLPLDDNLIDMVWDDRPSPPASPIYALPDEVTGCTVETKLAAVREHMVQADADVLILTKLDDIAWLTNLRGSDIDYNPVFEAYCMIDLQRVVCFTRVMPSQEMTRVMQPYLTFRAYGEYPDAVRRLAETPNRMVWLDPAGTTIGTRLLLAENQRLYTARSPVVLLKAVKNVVEISSSCRAHHHAAVAKIRSLARLERMLVSGQQVSEQAYAEMLYEEYACEEGFRELSFSTIAAAGANGAMVHYSEANPNVYLKSGDLFLVDSGIQVLGGTTDDTRTVCIGTPDKRQCDLYTLVLRCHIRLAKQKFPEGTSGHVLDGLARSLMWDAGLDYGHGTGHGVGAFLNVHEGPQRLATRGSDEPLRIGMIVSNEPGYYEQGWGGIRLENLYVVVLDEETPPHPSGKRWLQFKPLTLIPFDKRLIDWGQLSEAERGWLQHYHQEVWESIAPMLQGADRDWLHEACEVWLG